MTFHSLVKRFKLRHNQLHIIRKHVESRRVENGKIFDKTGEAESYEFIPEELRWILI